MRSLMLCVALAAEGDLAGCDSNYPSYPEFEFEAPRTATVELIPDAGSYRMGEQLIIGWRCSTCGAYTGQVSIYLVKPTDPPSLQDAVRLGRESLSGYLTWTVGEVPGCDLCPRQNVLPGTYAIYAVGEAHRPGDKKDGYASRVEATSHPFKLVR